MLCIETKHGVYVFVTHAWWLGLWKEKEVMLKRFYEDKTFEKMSKEVKGEGVKKINAITRTVMTFALVYWLIFCIGAVYLVSTQDAFFYYSILAICVYVFISFRFDGMEMLELRLYGPNLKVKKE